MEVRFHHVGITERQIALFRRIVDQTVKRNVPDSQVGVLLVCVGSMAGWPQLAELEELERDVDEAWYDREYRSELKQTFLHNATLIEDKVRIAWFNETGEILKLS